MQHARKPVSARPRAEAQRGSASGSFSPHGRFDHGRPNVLLMGALTRIGALAICAVVLTSANGAESVPERQDQAERAATTLQLPMDLGFTNWSVVRGAPGTALITTEETTPEGEIDVIEARADERTDIRSRVFPVRENTAYLLCGWIHAVKGGSRCTFNLLWHDLSGRFMGQDYAHVLPLVSGAARVHEIELISPPGAHQARVRLELPPGTHCRLGSVSIKELPQTPPRLSVDLCVDPLGVAWASPPRMHIRLENRGVGRLTDLQCQIALPEGVSAARPLTVSAPDLGHGESWTGSWVLSRTPAPIEGVFACSVTGSRERDRISVTAEAAPFQTIAAPIATESTKLSCPPLPRMPIQLGAYYFPVMLDWDRRGWGVRPVRELEPLLGYYDEARPDVADWHIAWARQHGISVFVFDWYFNKGMHFLNDALEKGFLNSRFRDRMGFCIDWCNEGHCNQFKLVDFQDASLRLFITALCERYFVHENYVRIEGKPLVLIHMPVALANDRGGWEGCRRGLEMMREIARGYGHGGVHFVAVQSNYPYVLDYQKGGFDAVAPYAYGFAGVPRNPQTRALPYAALIPRHRDMFARARSEAHSRRLEYIPSAWVGWNDAARSHERAVSTAGNTPSAFRTMVGMLPQYVEPSHKLALFEAWNEWGEGGHAEPGRQYGFGRLSALRDALSNERGPYQTPVPTAASRQTMATDVTHDQVVAEYERRYAEEIGLGGGLALTFESPDDLYLRPKAGVTSTRVADGAQHGRAFTRDPVLLSPPFIAVDTGKVTSVRVRLRAQSGSRTELFWRTDEQGWHGNRSLALTLNPDGDYHDYVFELNTHPEWGGLVHQFRFDPMDAPGRFSVNLFETETPPLKNAHDGN